MRHKLRIALLFLLLCLPGIVGGTWAWYAAAGAQPPFLRVLAALAGAAAGCFVAGLLSIIVRGVTGSVAGGRAEIPPKLSLRDRNLLIEERQLGYAAWLRRWTWVLALAPAILVAILTVASGLTVVNAITMLVALFAVLWFAIRSSARFTTRTVTQDREYRKKVEGRTFEPHVPPRVDPDA